MICFGPVSQASHGGRSSPAFDLIVGFAVLALTWIGYIRTQKRTEVSIWIAIGISVICGVFIYSGIIEMLR